MSTVPINWTGTIWIKSPGFKLIRITPLDTSTSPVPITLERTAVPDPGIMLAGVFNDKKKRPAYGATGELSRLIVNV